jgi:hypothetical protein
MRLQIIEIHFFNKIMTKLSLMTSHMAFMIDELYLSHYYATSYLK